ncbi:ABC transporter ATP-binding protein [Halobacillus seohaensis]|uniref:ABC transporter ATP-binding protein n=1 Tax=Halobacillus seohaensis TaxID=447421 RepID=A0ABW2ERU3_9BACI
MTIAIEVNQLTKKFRTETVLNQLSFKMNEGEKLSIVGPSGSGKSTLLRILAGLENPSHGSIILGGKNVTTIGARKRNIGLVFQQPLLFPHMTVEENIAYGAKVMGGHSKEKTTNLLEAINLTKAKSQFPNELSGGQQQRVALARALATEPDILLLDEPFSSLDPNLRQELRYWVRKLLTNHSITSIFVTHDHEEAMLMGDKIGLFHEGKFQQIASAYDIHNSPANPFVVKFFGNHLLLDDNHYVHLESISLSNPKDKGITFHAELLQTTYYQGQMMAHLFIIDLAEKITLRVTHTSLSKHLTIHIPENSIHQFNKGQGTYE